MNFGEEMVVILNKLVVPKYAPIDSVVYKMFGDVGVDRYYEIIYIIKKDRVDEVDRDMKTKIVLNTMSMVDMVGIQGYEDYSVHFGIGKRKLYWV
jgi:hypothetical protein